MDTKEYLRQLGSELGVVIDIRQNHAIPSLGNLIIDGILTDEVCPFYKVLDDFDQSYYAEFPDGTRRPHQPKSYIKIKAEKFIAINKEDPELYADNKIN